MTKLSRKRLKQHLAALRKELKANPQNLSARVNLARTHLILGEENQAIRQYSHIARIAVRANKLQKAIAACHSILRLRPNLSMVVDMLARLHARNPANQDARVGQPISEADARAFLEEQAPPPEPVIVIKSRGKLPQEDQADDFDLSVESFETIEPQPLKANSSTAAWHPVTDSPTMPESLVSARMPDADEVEELSLDDQDFLADMEDIQQEDVKSIDESIEALGDDPEGAVSIDDDWEVYEVDDDDILTQESVDLDPYPAPRNPMELSRQVPLFSKLDLDSFVRLVKSIEVKNFTDGAKIFREGNQAEGFYILVAGAVELSRRNAYGDTCPVTTLNPGDFFGTGVMFGEPHHRLSAEALGAVETMVVQRNELEAIAASNPAIRTMLETGYRNHLARELLGTVSLFRDMSQHDREALLELFRSERHAPGSVVLHQDESVSGLYLICRGEIEVLRQEQGETLPVARMTAGDFLGILGLLDNSTSQTALRASEDSYLLKLPRESFERVYREHQAFRRAVDRARSMRQLMVDAVYSGGE